MDPFASNSEDPYHAVQSEIAGSLQAARTLCSSYIRVRGYGSAREEESEAREELQTALDLLEVDLEDLDESVKIVESSSGARSFGLSNFEVQERRRYVEQAKKEIRTLRANLPSSSTPRAPLSPNPLSPRPSSPVPGFPAAHPLATGSRTHSRVNSGGASAAAPAAVGALNPTEDDDQSEWARAEQQMLIEQQDRTIHSIAGTLTTLAQQAGLMGQEIGEHVELLDDLEQNVDRSDNKLQDAMKRMRKFVRDTEETKSGWCIVILIIVLVILLLAVILV
ncbi:hypothetical protein HGRIS_011672 [Hohenbuehelia grisea]|uniref:t-SNARE coiled-coil homology domain-containing protein n=1 Tax=Hohenbuehelia grisea TaxID=104357 RepID=A0ABR3JWN1_9AGAR